MLVIMICINYERASTIQFAVNRKYFWLYIKSVQIFYIHLFRSIFHPPFINYVRKFLAILSNLAVIHESNHFLEPWKIVLILIQHPVPVPKVVKSDKTLIKVVKPWKTRSNKKWSVYQKPTDHFEMGFFNFSHHQGLTVLAIIITGLLILDVHLRNQFYYEMLGVIH